MSTKIFFFPLMDIKQGHISHPFSWVEACNRILVNRMNIEVIFVTSRLGPRTPPSAFLCLPGSAAGQMQRRQQMACSPRGGLSCRLEGTWVFERLCGAEPPSPLPGC